MSETKQCNQCHFRKPLCEFTFLDKKLGKLYPSCKECKYYPKPADGTTNKRCTDCDEVKHYKNDFPASNTCCKPCFVLRKYVRDAEKIIQDAEKKVTESKQTQLPFKPVTPVPEPEPEPETVQDFLTCERCNEMRPLNDYHANNKKKCKHCVQELKAEKMKDVHEFLKNKWHRAKSRAKEKNLEFTITLEQWKYIYFAIQQGLCALSGLFMTHEASSKLDDEKEDFPFNISPDRKDSTKGYTFENVQFVCWCLNSAKNNMEQDEFIQMCGKVWEYHNKPKEPHWTPET
jgi:hypothetical protein